MKRSIKDCTSGGQRVNFMPPDTQIVISPRLWREMEALAMRLRLAKTTASLPPLDRETPHLFNSSAGAASSPSSPTPPSKSSPT